MVVWNEDRRLFGASQFQPPSFKLVAEEPIDQPIAGLTEIATKRENPTVDAGLDLTLEKRCVAEFRPPGELVANEAHRALGLIARRVEPHVPQEQ